MNAFSFWTPALLLDLALRGSLVLAAAALAAFALRRAPASARHLAWAVGLAGLLALPVLGVALPAWRVELLPEEPRAVAADPPAIAQTPAASPVIGQPAALRPEPRPAPGRRIAWTGWILGVWLAGVGAALWRLGASVVRVRREERAAHSLTEGPAADACRRMVWRLEIDRPVRLLESSEGSMPLTWGVIRPRVLLPAGTAAWPADRLEAVLLHELAHVRRRDCAWQLVAEAACALHWFNPLAWAAAQRLRLESEHAADDQVLVAGRRGCDYAGHLLEVARTLRPPRAAALAHVAMARPSQLRTRLQAVLSADRPRGPVPLRLAAPALMVAVALVALIAALTPSRAGAADTLVMPGSCSTAARGSEGTDLQKGGVWTTEWSNRAGCGGRARIEGRVTFTPEMHGVAEVPQGGRFWLELRDGRRSTSVDVRAADGGLRRTFRVDGRPQPWDARAEGWLAEAIPALMRQTSYGARAEPAGREPQELPDDRIDRPGATTTLVHTDAASGTETMLLARNAWLREDRGGIERISADGWVIFRENAGRTSRRVEIRPGRDGFTYRWGGDFTGVDRQEWLRRMMAEFAKATEPRRRW